MTKRNPIFLDRSNLAWEFLLNWDAKDSSWNSNDWTATNVSFIESERWYTKEVWSFNWSTSKIDVPHISAYSSVSFSLSVWVKRASNHTWYIYFKDQSWNNNHDFHITSLSSNEYKAQLQTWSWQANLNVTAQTWIWEHLVFTSDWSTSQKFYLNNWTPVTDSVSWTLSWNSLALDIWHFNWATEFDWEIWLIRHYSKVLSASEINDLYHEWLRKLWPANKLQYSEIFESAKFYAIFHWNWDDILTWISPTEDWTPADTSDHNWLANKAKTFDWVNESYDYWNDIFKPWTWNFTVLNIFKYTNTSASSLHAWSTSDTTPYARLVTRNNWEDLKFDVFDWSTNPWAETSSANLNDWNWHSCFCRKKANNDWDMYIDKSQQATSTVNMTGTLDIASPLKIAERSGANYWDWDISITLYWDRALTDAECDLVHDLMFKKDIYRWNKYWLPNLQKFKSYEIIKRAVSWTYHDQTWNWANWVATNVIDSSLWLHNVMWFNWSSSDIDSNYLLPATSDPSFTICYSFKTTTTSVWYILDNNPSWWSEFIIIQTNADWTIRIATDDTVGSINQFTSVVNDWNWHDICHVRDWVWNTLKTYVDAIEVATVADTRTGNFQWWDFSIWKNRWWASQFLDADLANIEIYEDKALSPKEILQRYYSNFITN